jgi:hypothetical protein
VVGSVAPARGVADVVVALVAAACLHPPRLQLLPLLRIAVSRIRFYTLPC